MQDLVNKKQTWTLRFYRREMASSVLRVSYRPLRIGFLVRHGEIADVLSSVEFNTVLWGGIYNPLIPVGGATGLDDQLIRTFRVDLLHPISNVGDVKALFESHSHLPWPESLLGQSGFSRDFEGRSWLGAMDIVPWIIRHRWEPGLVRSVASDYVVVDWNESDPLAGVLSLTFGRFPPASDNLPIDYRQVFIDNLAAHEVPIFQGHSFPDMLAFRRSPLDFTGLELKPDRVHHWHNHGVYIGSVDCGDFINFWNLRASGIDLIFIPTPLFDRLRHYATKHIENLLSWARQDPGRRRLGVWVRRGQAIPSEVSELFPRDVQWSRIDVDEVTWNGLNVQPPVYRLEQRQVIANLDTSRQEAVSLDFAIPPLIDVEELPLGYSWQHVITSIVPGTEFAYEGNTLHLPFLPDLNEWYSRRVVLHPHELRVEMEGVGKISDLSTETLHITPVKGVDVVHRILERAAINARTSLPGRVAHQLIQQMDGLEGCRVFKIRGVRGLIRSDEAHDGVTRGRATDIIHDRDPVSGVASFTRFAGLFIEPRERPQLTTSHTFDYLLKRGIFRPGLQLVCPRCNLDYWMGMPIGETCSCEFCGHSFNLAPYLQDRGDWRFRVSGLFGRKAGEEGAIPVVLSLLQLLRTHHAGATFLYACGTSLQSMGLDCEADLVAVERGREGETSILLGECKSYMETNDGDVNNLTMAARLILDSGVNCYLLFAKTADAFSQAEIDRFRTLSQNGLSLILFTARELEPYSPYDETPERETLPDRYPGDFEGLARNSSWLYLRGQVPQ